MKTGGGEVPTPAFMPVGTQGAVKAVEPRELQEIGYELILANTYHLYLRPGMAVIEKAGGLHRFVAWGRSILTDSGGYQVFSLADLRGISDEGVHFKSHLDGSIHLFTPELVVDLQRSLGSDIAMVLDECVAYPCEEAYAREASLRTIQWAERARRRWEQTSALYDRSQMLFAIVQGSTFPALREEAVRALSAFSFDGYAIGGLSVGEPEESLYRITETCTAVLPAEAPRYLMGVGTPENILECISRGVDMFDCVLPTRNGRNATLFTGRGRLSMKNLSHADDNTPVDPDCGCYTCRNFSRAYLRHLFKAGEILALQLATLHNLSFYLRLVERAREAILQDRFEPWKEEQIRVLAEEVSATT